MERALVEYFLRTSSKALDLSVVVAAARGPTLAGTSWMLPRHIGARMGLVYTTGDMNPGAVVLSLTDVASRRSR